MKISFLPDGTIRRIYSEEIPTEMFGEVVAIKRASHVEPCPGGWSADLSPVNGPVLGPYRRRSEALRAEVGWLEQHYL